MKDIVIDVKTKDGRTGVFIYKVIPTEKIERLTEHLFKNIVREIDNQIIPIIERMPKQSLLINMGSLQGFYKTAILSLVSKTCIDLQERAIAEAQDTDKTAIKSLLHK